MGESEEVEKMWQEHEGDNSPIRSGWSITVGELRKAIENVPDDYEVMLENAEVEDCEISTVNINLLYPPSITGSPGLVILGGGQIVSSEYDFYTRMDVHLEAGGYHRWNKWRKDLFQGWVNDDGVAD